MHIYIYIYYIFTYIFSVYLFVTVQLQTENEISTTADRPNELSHSSIEEESDEAAGSHNGGRPAT